MGICYTVRKVFYGFSLLLPVCLPLSRMVFLLHIFPERLCQVDAGLVGETYEYPKHVGHFICQILFLSDSLKDCSP